MFSILLGLIIYFVVVLIIGIKSSGENRTHEDFLIANRKLGPFAIALSERASGESAWIVLGLPGAALVAGLAELWTVIGCLLGIIFSWLFIAKPLREKAGTFNSLTIPDLISSYFQDDSNLIRISSSLIITFFFSLYVAAQFSGAGKILNTTFGLHPNLGMFLGCGLIIFYTILGGFRAVVWTDIIQALLMITTLVILPIIGFLNLIKNGSLGDASPLPLTDPNGNAWSTPPVVLSGLSWGLGYLGQPHLLIRYLAIKDPAQVKLARKVAFVWAIPAFFGAYFLGIVGLKLYGNSTFLDPEKVMPYMATQLLPGILAGILISGAIAAMMSTADSQLLVTTSAITEDLIHKVAKINLKQKQFLLINRLSTLFVGILAFILALTSKELVFSLVSYAWSGLGSSFGPVILSILFWKKVTKRGALAGMWTGALSTILWKNIKFLNALMTERLASFVLALVVIILVSLCDKEKKLK